MEPVWEKLAAGPARQFEPSTGFHGSTRLYVGPSTDFRNVVGAAAVLAVPAKLIFGTPDPSTRSGLRHRFWVVAACLEVGRPFWAASPRFSSFHGVWRISSAYLTHMYLTCISSDLFSGPCFHGLGRPLTDLVSGLGRPLSAALLLRTRIRDSRLTDLVFGLG